MSELTYKKIVDVEQVETLNDGITVFINDNGAMKQVAANEFGLGTVKTVNGIEPDENGAVEFDKAFPVLITHMIFPAFSDIKCNKTCEEIYNGILTQEINAASIALLRYFSTSEEEYRYCTNVVLEKVDRNFTKRFFFYFGDDIAPYIIDVEANTITIDPDWVAPTPCVKTVNGIAPDENGEIASYHSISFNFVDGSAIVPGLITYYGTATMAELCAYYDNSGMYNVECRRIIMSSGNTAYTRNCIGEQIVKDSDGNTTGRKLFFGDDLCPVILDIASNKIIFDPDWVAPTSDITIPSGATLTIEEGATVVDNAGALGGSGGIEPLYVELSEDETTLVTSWDDIVTAHTEKRPMYIVGYSGFTSGPQILTGYVGLTSSPYGFAYFYGLSIDASGIAILSASVCCIRVNADGTVTKYDAKALTLS